MLSYSVHVCVCVYGSVYVKQIYRTTRLVQRNSQKASVEKSIVGVRELPCLVYNQQ